MQEKDRVKGFIINKFRGDVSSLESGIRMLEEKGMSFIILTVSQMERIVCCISKKE